MDLLCDNDDEEDDQSLRPSLLFINVPHLRLSTNALEFHAMTDVVRKVLMHCSIVIITTKPPSFFHLHTNPILPSAFYPSQPLLDITYQQTDQHNHHFLKKNRHKRVEWAGRERVANIGNTVTYTFIFFGLFVTNGPVMMGTD